MYGDVCCDNRTETQNIEKHTNTSPNTSKQRLLKKERINLELIKKNIKENKTTLPSLRNQHFKKSRKKIIGRQIITKYLNKQHHLAKRTNLCRRETCL